MSDDKVQYCTARTNAQLFGGSWASSSWGCSRRATEEFKGRPLCWQHARMAKTEGMVR